MSAMSITPLSDAARARAIVIVCACAALAFGAFAALGTESLALTILIVAVFLVGAWILPLNWVACALVALIPLQFYFPFAGGLYLRGALVFVFTAALRVLVIRLVRSDQGPGARGQGSAVSRLRSLMWSVPAALFVAAALIAAVAAPNRYAALKGVYDWLPIFATAFVVGEIVRTPRALQRIVGMLIAIGIGEAALGLAQAALDVPRIVSILQLPFSGLIYQPGLLRDRLSDLSFNWIVFDRVLPFGTFINGIDYAIFLAAILSLALALLLDARLTTASGFRFQVSSVAHHVLLFICLALSALALLQTLKGSGMIALAGGVGVIALLFVRRISPRVLALGAMILIGALVLATPFYDALIQRAIFLIQRESGVVTGSGRLAIWAHLLTYLPQRPWFGWGLNNTGLLVQPLPSLSGGAFVFNIPTAESAYIAALVETGIIGFAALMLFIGVVLVRAYGAARRSALMLGTGAAIVAMLFGSLTVVGLTTDQNGMLFGVLIGLIFSFANDL